MGPIGSARYEIPGGGRCRRGDGPDELVRRRSTAGGRGGRRAAGGERWRVQCGRVGAGDQVWTAVDVLLRLLGGSAWSLAAAQQPLSTCVSPLIPHL